MRYRNRNMSRSTRAALAALALLSTLSACATTSVATAPDPYVQVNRALRGERAIVELARGDFAAGVTHVRFDGNEVSWIENGDTRTVPAGEVSRVIVLRPNRDHGAAGLVLLVGLGLSLAFDDARPFALALDVALDDFVWGAAVGPEVGRVVYSAESLD